MKAYSEFVDLVEEMRIAQKDYFKARYTPEGQTTQKLDHAKALERKVDKSIAEIKKTKPECEQTTLF